MSHSWPLRIKLEALLFFSFLCQPRLVQGPGKGGLESFNLPEPRGNCNPRLENDRLQTGQLQTEHFETPRFEYSELQRLDLRYF